MEDRPKKAYIIRGLPGSGKSTTAKRMAEMLGDSSRQTAHLEQDQYFTKRGVYKFDRRKIRQATEWCLEEFVKALAEGKIPFVANTFTQKKEIDHYVNAAKEAGAKIIIITCTGQYGSIHNMPMGVMVKLAKRNLTPQQVANLYPDAIHLTMEDGKLTQKLTSEEPEC